MGTVGRGVYRILTENASLIALRVGVPIEVARVLVKDRYKDRGVSIPQTLLTEDPLDILDDPDIDIIVEVIGGTKPARELVLKAFSRGKSVITANKDMMAEHGKELFKAARQSGRDLLFEASVAGGIPIIRVLKECLAGDRIRQVMGIVNGTTNYMLTRMSREGADFESVLRSAQAAGYAEADPTNDIEGYDAARKIAILASIAFNTRIALDDVYVEGITRVTAEDIRYADELGYVVKLLGIARDTDEGVEVRVHPALLPKSHPLAAVNDVFNAVFLEGVAVGETMFYGRGAGELPTASAVVGDVIDAARNLWHRVPGVIGCTCFQQRSIKPMGHVVSRNYLRLRVDDNPGVLSKIAFVFGQNQVSLASVIQKQTVGAMAELVLITHDVAEENLRRALTTLAELPEVDRVFNVIRVVDVS